MNMKYSITPTMITQDRIEWQMKQEIDGATTALNLAICNLKDQAVRDALTKLGWAPPERVAELEDEIKRLKFSAPFKARRLGEPAD